MIKSIVDTVGIALNAYTKAKDRKAAQEHDELMLYFRGAELVAKTLFGRKAAGNVKDLQPQVRDENTPDADYVCASAEYVNDTDKSCD